MNSIQKQQYAQFNQHIIVADPYLYEDNEELLTGFAIRKEDLGSFMLDLEALVKRYGGVDFDELAENDWEGDSSAYTAHREVEAEKKTRRDATEPIEVGFSVAKGELPS